MTIKRRPLLWGLAVLAIAGGGLALRSGFSARPQATVMTAPVTVGSIEETVLANGILKPVRLVAVGAQASGRITAVHVKTGDTITAGSLIAEIDSVTQQNDVRTTEAALANVRAQRAEKEATLLLARQTLARQQKMVSQRAVSQADYDSAVADVAATTAQIAALDAQIAEAGVAVDNARANLGYTRITAPIDGTVLAVVSQEGQTVNSTQSAPTIIVLGDLTAMTVRAEISEADVVSTRPGQAVWFTILGEADRRFEAKLAAIEPAPESVRNDSSFSTTTSSSSTSSSSSEAIYYNGVFTVPNPDGVLRTYMTAEVHILLAEAHDVLTIPASALGARGADGRYTVRVLGADGAVSGRAVEIGLNNRIMAEVRSGLEKGDRVVTGEAGSAAASGQRFGPPPML
ncbi:efflux RND transporter periplasmic adaptor subunit [Pseudoxanthobacter sp.]|uniref:efflux RND transporter periplasmic adaptor subunit n=1 Tax=Pseudoxanthobacter sp. TaxID=1925742 RepID=UPI002FE188D4